MNIHSLFTKLHSLFGYFSAFIWCFFVFFYIPNSAKHDFIEHKDEFYSIMTFVQIFMFYILQIFLTIVFSLCGTDNKKFVVNSKYKIINILTYTGILLNFITIILFTIFIIYIAFFYS